ncbi:SURF1 family cytochrome oxidase biogenesis protein [Janibacter limosus]|jgi:cytochrome oxidase assembly protein ShyY1|uniref:SURF1-like protein n=1 Tax=Janibacter limosus TaxID=53458 RepID=A0A4P6MVM9_9MICO|nr:SURF1 family protein [Janibacter limosus]QBF45885.1 SURF1 family protein [Janibacter limosus]
MLRRALTPRWLGWFAVALVVSIAFVWLGQWQWGRYEDKAARADRIDSHYTATPVPVTEVLSDSPAPVTDEWTRVTATGEYLADEQLLVRNRPLDGAYGYEVLVPLRLTGGQVLLVDRGWVDNSPKGADVAPEVPPAPEGEVTATGWVRLGEKSLGRRMQPGQLASINLQEAAAEVDGQLLGGYLSLQSEDPTVPRPAPLEVPDTGTGPHMAYAVQWWLAIPAFWIFLVMALRREVQDGSERSPRPKKVRIWDEEDG